MDLLGRLRHAEQQGKSTVHHAAEKFKQVESAIRRRVKGGQTVPASAYPDPEQESTPSAKARTGIVSVNGRDIEKMHCTGGR